MKTTKETERREARSTESEASEAGGTEMETESGRTAAVRRKEAPQAGGNEPATETAAPEVKRPEKKTAILEAEEPGAENTVPEVEEPGVETSMPEAEEPGRVFEAPPYGALARWYDAFTADVPYGAFADYYESLLRRGPGDRERMTLLDLCCGTGAMTLPLALRGHEMIGVDRSPEMLSQARRKAETLPLETPPLFLCQAAEELDLYGTVQGALCGLDGMNYLPPEDLPEVFHRLHLFLEPGGRLVFDLQSPERLRSLDGGVFVDETEEALCLWRGEFDPEENALFYGMDIFSRTPEGLWQRWEEEHAEYAHDPAALLRLLARSGFRDAEVRVDGPQAAEGRLFITAVNGA